jgi:predicted lipoprotein with Yx(FWY)xxD motif
MRTRIGILGAALLTASLAAACGSGGRQSDEAASTSADAAKHSSASVKVVQSSLGPILTDQQGRTLYAFADDKGGASSCTGECIATWPALTSRAPVTAAAGATSSLVGKTERTEGTTQATYGEWPLYYYAGDAQAGDANGQGVDGVWFVLGPDGKLIRKTA